MGPPAWASRSPALYAGAATSLGMLAFSVNDVLIKALSGGYALHQIVLFRSLAALIFVLAVVLPLSGGPRALRFRRPGMHALRGLVVFLANMTFYLALAVVPLADAMAVFFIAPALITALSVPVLGERVGPWRWFAVLVGLAGVMLIIQPGGAGFRWAMLLPALSALAYATMQLITRRYGVDETTVSLTFSGQVSFLALSGLSGLMFGDGHLVDSGGAVAAFMFRPWVWPPLSDLWVFLGMGTGSALGGFLVASAYRSADAALAASFEYLAVPLSLIWGLVLFGEWPGRLALSGIALIVASGLILVWRETRSRRPPTGDVAAGLAPARPGRDKDA